MEEQMIKTEGWTTKRFGNLVFRRMRGDMCFMRLIQPITFLRDPLGIAVRIGTRFYTVSREAS